MQIDLTINKGRGYVPADENRQFCTDVNVLPIDSIYTPSKEATSTETMFNGTLGTAGADPTADA